MNKIKVAVIMLVTMMGVSFVKAQTLEDGRKFLYYEKYISAKSVFEKLLAANPNNTDAAYWLGQTLIRPEEGEGKDVAAAKELYRKTLEANSNNALLTAGMGHIELLEGKTQDARNRFETAISLSQGKNIQVLNAIGFANADFDSKNGDAAYAIEKLKQATAIKGFKDAETYTILGDAYRKIGDGGAALTAYQSALSIDPKYARAKFRIGKIYQTQGISQKDVYMPYYNDAIALDPNYTPVYYNLYRLEYETNVVKSAEYLEKYLSLQGQDEPNACYYRATIKYAQGLFAEAITQAEGCIAAGGASPDPRLYGLKGYAYDRLNDSVNAKTAFEMFFKTQKPEKIGPTDIGIFAKILLKFPGNEALAGTMIDKAVALDSTEAGKVTLLKSMATRYEGLKNYIEAANWYKKIVDVKKAPTKTDIYNYANNFSKGGNYQAAIDGWNIYTAKYPNETYGFYMTAITQAKIDTALTAGLAAPNYQKVIELGEAQWATDSAKVKTHLLNAYKYFIEYTYNIQKDKKGASDYAARYLVKAPDDVEVQDIKKKLDAPTTTRPPATRPPATPARPATTKPSTGSTTTPKTGSTTEAKKK